MALVQESRRAVETARLFHASEDRVNIVRWLVAVERRGPMRSPRADFATIAARIPLPCHVGLECRDRREDCGRHPARRRLTVSTTSASSRTGMDFDAHVSKSLSVR